MYLASSGHAPEGCRSAGYHTAQPRPRFLASCHNCHKCHGVQPIMLQVDGIPRPQPRPRFARGRVISCADANAKRWISAVEAKAREPRHQDGPLKGGLFVGLVFTFPAGKGRQEGEAHVSRPDADNLAKLVLDCLMRAGMIGDDAIVSSLMIRKSYGAKPGVLIYLNEDRRAPDRPAPSWID